jgi:hypothetical protein
VQPQSNVWWIGPLVLVLIRVVVGQARKAMAIRQCDSVVFGVAPLFRWLGGFFLVAMCLLFVRDFRHEESWVLVTGAVGVGLFCLAWPASFICSGTGLVKHIWWRRAISLPWSEVVQLEETQGGDLNVYGGNGECFCFTRFHVDPVRFRAEVLKRANLRCVVPSSAPTSLR